MILPLRYPGLAPRGYYQAPQVGLHKVDGLLFAALCGFAALREAAVAVVSRFSPQLPSAPSAASALRSVPLLPLCSVRNPQSTFAEATADKSAIDRPRGHSIQVHSQNSIPYMVLGRALTPH